MNEYIVGFQAVSRADVARVGGKGANLGELARLKGIRVPDGFCVSTKAFQEVIAAASPIRKQLDQLARLTLADREPIALLSSEVRQLIEGAAFPEGVAEAVGRELVRLGEQGAYAVRSSATAEDLPTASFAGQQDTYLNIIGKEAILQHVRRCWASLFTERAVTYRLQAGFDHRKVHLAVVVQQMVFPQAAGVLFTADPLTSNRKVVSIDASFGLGEALVSGLVNADNYQVRDGNVIGKKLATKERAVVARTDGGTTKVVIEPERQNQPVLTDEQIQELARIGRQIEAHFGQPQDVEWCLADGVFYIVQSRPITTLYPIPETDDAAATTSGLRVYVSVGHQQMMTDPMKPLGLSVWQLTAGRPMYPAGGRLFVDVTPELASPARRDILINVLGKSDPYIKSALTTLLEREIFGQPQPDGPSEPASGKNQPGLPPPNYQALNDYDPSVVTELIRQSEAEVDALKQAIRTKSGPDLIDFIYENLRQLRQHLADPQRFGVIMTAMNAASWINDQMQEWLGEKAVADTLSQSVPNNVTSEMGLALLDVADAIRPYPAVTAYLQRADPAHFWEELVRMEGGSVAQEAIRAFLERYGMRCVGEIDLTRTRWSEKPTTLVPLILSNIRNFEPGAGKRKFERGQQEALQKEQELLDRLNDLPDGEQKGAETRRAIRLLRALAGYREYPKYSIVSRYAVYRRALLDEAGRLLEAGVIREKEDIDYLSLAELGEVVRTRQLDFERIRRRKEAYRFYDKLTPPRVITSDGEIITGAYHRDNLPADALVGLAVSAGVVEGRARVLFNIEDANLEEGDILVTPFTDPSWTPLFVAIKGLVTEVGGLMTHGAVIAREYGLPAVVGVEKATSQIRDGQRIRLNGTEGYVEVLTVDG